MPTSPVNVTGLDHIVLVVADVEASLAFYHDKLGLPDERVDEWRAGDIPFPSVRISDHLIIDFFAGNPAGTNVDHFALTVDPQTDLHALAASGEFDVVSGPNSRWGARGMGTSLSVSDPDGNTVELKAYDS